MLRRVRGTRSVCLVGRLVAGRSGGTFIRHRLLRLRLALRLTLLTLVRKSELLLARWEHVDLDKAEWSIPAAKERASG